MDSPFVDGGVVGPNVAVFGQFLLWIAAGAGVLLLSADDLRTHRDPVALLLFLWVVGTTVFAAYVNWTLNGRSILPLVPAVALTLVRRLDREPLASWALPALLGSAAALSLAVCFADACVANANRTAAREFVAEWQSPGGRQVWFQGHWGFQFYAQNAGARPWDYPASGGKTGDFLIVPFNNCMTHWPDGFGDRIATATVDACSWATTNAPFVGAGYYACHYEWRPLPFVFGAVPPEGYFIYRLTKDQPPVPLKR
jgi:hypothetical protein